MKSSKLLLLSSSRVNDCNYLEYAKLTIYKLLGDIKEVVFIPFAGVTIDWNNYTDKVQEALTDIKVIGLHRNSDLVQVIKDAKAIVIGGGNSFHLLHCLYKYGLIDVIRNRVLNDNVPYIGWSAGSNVAAPNIRTTNDMPIIWPPTDAALNMVPFNINPHYNMWKPENFHGETRDDRLNEFCCINDRPVVALGEGTAILVEDNKYLVIAPDNTLPDICAKIWIPCDKSDKKNKAEIRNIEMNTDIKSVIGNSVE